MSSSSLARPNGRSSFDRGSGVQSPHQKERTQAELPARVLGLGIALARIPHEPSDQTDGCQSESPGLQEPPGPRRTSFGRVSERTVDIRPRRRDRRAGASAPLGRRDPPRDGRERFRRADRALLRVMNLLAVQTQSGDSELHALECTQPAVRRYCGACGGWESAA